MIFVKNETSTTLGINLGGENYSILAKQSKKITGILTDEDENKLEALRKLNIITTPAESLCAVGFQRNIIGNTEINFSQGSYAKIVLQANATLTFESLDEMPRLVVLQIAQDEDGSHTLAFSGANILGASGFTMTSTAERTDILLFQWTGVAFVLLTSTQNIEAGEDDIAYTVDPTVVSAANTDAAEDIVSVVFDIEVQVTDATGWTCLVDGVAVVVSTVAASNNTVTVTLARDLVASEVAVLHYNHLTGNLKDENGKAVMIDYTIAVTNAAT